MSVSPTTLRLEPTWRNKGVKVTGSPAVREKVELTLVDAADVAQSVVVRIFGGVVVPTPCAPGKYYRDKRYDFARFPLEEGDVWEVDNDDLVATINFNTIPLLQQFHGLAPDDAIEAFVSVENGATDNQYALGRIVIRNWCVAGDDPVPGSSKLAQEVGEMADMLADHKHTGADGSSVISHTDLINIGSLSHGQLESKISVIEGDVSLTQNSLSQHSNNKDNPHEVTAAQVGAVTNADIISAFAAHNAADQGHGDLRDHVASLEIVQTDIIDALGAGLASVDSFNPDVDTDYYMRIRVKQLVDFVRGLQL